jgi:hypothetical protein
MRLPAKGCAKLCPSEGTGCAQGYEELLEALADPIHPEHAEQKRWIGRPFDHMHSTSTRSISNKLLRGTASTTAFVGLLPTSPASVSSSLLVLQLSMQTIDPWKTKNGGQSRLRSFEHAAA